ncbi:MAG: ABC transporter ATP-binding protein [Methanobrevibacter sp.]|nr:ABC transporter ATP-binding protein [Methanobrevibacter sp.]
MERLQLKNVGFTYKTAKDEKVIFREVNIEFKKGVLYGLIGESGTGKTTLLSIVAGLDERYSGVLLYNGMDMRKMDLNEYRKKSISFITQKNNLLSHLSALENIEISVNLAGKSMSRKDILDVLNKYGIDKKTATRRASELSGGEQQRVAVAMAVCRDNDIIFADEPTASLDDANAENIVKILKVLSQEGKCIIMATHNKKLLNYCDIVYRINCENKSIEMVKAV